MADKPQFYFINDRIITTNETGLLLSDLGLFRAYGVFDYFRTHGGKPFLVDAYLARFRESAAQLRLPLNYTDQEIIEVIDKLISLNGRTESGVRLLITGGYSDNMFTPSRPNLIIRIEKSVLPPEEDYRAGIKVITVEYMRDLPLAKTTNYLVAIQKWPEVEKAGAAELLYSWKGKLLECSRSNFFVVVAGSIFTAPKGLVLAGVTRNRVINIARNLGINVVEEAVPARLMKSCNEAFITATTKRVLPVVQVDNHIIGNGKPGEISKLLMEQWERLEQAGT